MSRELWLLRHGKAERYDSIDDYDRSLKKRGKRDAKRMARWMMDNNLLPDKVISSPATRAFMTTKVVCEELGLEISDISVDKRLYEEGLVRVRSVLADCPIKFSRVLLVGHNPELEDLLSYLVNNEQLPDIDKLMPTAGLARLLLPDEWSKLETGCAKLLDLSHPKLLTEGSLDDF